MDLRVLRYFLVIAREENITKAAQLLHLTQPTLSRQMMQLEEELGVKLFRRSNHHVILTEEGMLLKRRAGELVALAEKTKGEFAQNQEALSGEIAIGSGETLSMDILAELIAAFRRDHPLVSFDLCSGNADQIKEGMERGAIDIALLLEPVDMTKYDFLRLEVKEQWGVLVREDSPLCQKAVVSPEDLKGIPLLMSKRALIRSELDHWLGDCLGDIQVASSFNLLYNAAVLAQHQVGAVLCLKLHTEYPGLKFLPLFPGLETGSALAWKKNQVFSRATEAFLDFIKKSSKCISSGCR